MTESQAATEQARASQALQDAVEAMALAFADEPGIVTDFIVTVVTANYTDDGRKAESFNLYFPHDARTGFTMALGMLERARRRILQILDDAADEDDD